MIVEFLLFLHFSMVDLIKRLRFCMVQWLQKSLMNCVFFLSFAKSFFREKAQIMVDLMLDSCFKGMDCIMDSIGKDQATVLMQQYDELVVMPLLKFVMNF